MSHRWSLTTTLLVTVLVAAAPGLALAGATLLRRIPPLWLSLLCFLVAVLASAVALVLGHWLTRTIRLLEQIIGAAAAGQLEVRARPAGPREVAAVVERLNHLLAAYQEAEQALRQSEERFSLAFYASPVAKSITALADGRIIDVNARFLALTGYPRDAVMGRTLGELHLWDDQAQQASLVALLEDDGAPRAMEIQARARDGRPVDVLLSAARIELEGRECILAVSEDITERKRVEAELRLRDRAIAAVQSGILITDSHQHDNPIVYCNPGFERLTGYEAHEVLGRNCRFLQGPDTDPATVATIRAALLDGRRCRVTIANYRKDGSLFWNDLIISPVHDAAGVVSHFIGIQTDITEVKQAELALRAAYAEVSQLTELLRRSRDVLRTIFDGLNQGLMLLDRSGQVLAVNQAMAAWFGVPSPQLVGASWADLRQRGGVFPGHLIERTLHDGRRRRRRERVTSGAGQQRVLDLQTLPLLDEGQALDQVIISVSDVTEQIQLETMAAQSEQFAATGRLAMTLAHELNTPLLSIQSCLHLAEQAQPERRADYLHVAREELRRVSRILDQLLDLHRPSTATVLPVDVNTLIEQVLLLTSGTLAKQRVRVERALAPHMPALHIRADHLRQIMLNLIFNAVDAMPRGGLLKVETAATSRPDHLRITVADSGEGMLPELQAQIFEPFLTTKPHGSGLGLTISQRLAREYGGSIAVTSVPGEGSVFTISFPLAST